MTSGISARRSAAKTEASPAYDRRREEIVKAATRVFNDRGLHGTSLRAIAETMEIDRASLYYYFASKEELFDAVIREVSVINVQTAESIHAEEGSAPDKVRKLVRLLMESYATYYPLLYVYIREDLGNVEHQRSAWAKEMKALNRRYDRAVTGIIQDGLNAGTIRPAGDAAVIAYGVIGMVNWTNRWFDPRRSKVSAEQIGDSFASMIIDGLRVPPAPKRR